MDPLLAAVATYPLAGACAAVLAAYLLGSVAFAIVWSRVFSLADPRTYGSRNPGATNVLRSGHKAAAVLTLLCDCAKGWLAVWLAQMTAERWHWSSSFTLNATALVAVAVFLGHLFPLYHRLRGGKGVATALGVILAISPWLALGTVATFAIVLLFFRYVSFASIVSAVFAAFYYVLLFGIDPLALAVGVIAALLIWRHAANVSRLLAGKETKIGAAAAPKR